MNDLCFAGPAYAVTGEDAPGLRTTPQDILRQHRLIRQKLGPTPAASLEALYGYGLSDREVGRYYGITPSSIRRLSRTLDVDRAAAT